MSTSRTWLEERFLAPVVLVCATEGADRIALRNGLDATQLLRPFSVFPETLFARIGDKSEVSSVRQFGVRLMRPECLREMDPKLRVEHFQSLMSESAEAEFALGEQLDSVLNAILVQKNITEPALDGQQASTLLQRSYPTWLSQFVVDYVSMVRCSYFDAIDHPVANLLVVASNTDAKVMLEELRLQEVRAKAPRDGMPCMDDDVLTCVVVLHDLSQGPALEHVVQAFGVIQQKYMAQRCTLLRINSIGNAEDVKPMDCSRFLAANPAVESIATNGCGQKYNRVQFAFGHWPSGKPKITGCHLSPTNLDEIQSCMNQFLSTSLFPHLDRKLRTLAAAINEKRQSTLSKVAAWFRKEDAGKAKAECWVASTDGSPAKYLHSSLEMQLRRAADLCMAMRDFEMAANYYRMCRQELQSTLGQRDFNRYLIAAAQEGIGLCQYFQGKLPLPCGGRGAPECRLETARDEYSKNAVHSYAFRTSLILFMICRARTPPPNDRANGILQQVLRAGVVSNNKVYGSTIHEMCAMTCLFVNPPVPGNQADSPATVSNDFPVRCRLREFARCMTIAGSGYVEVNQLSMALRCYLRAYRIYRRQASCSGSSRALMHEHMYTLIAHLFGRLQQPVKSISFATAAVVSGVPAFSHPLNAAKNMSNYWKRVGSVMQANNVTELPHMVLPIVPVAGLALQIPRCHADERTILEESQLPLDTAEKEWKVLEEGLRSHYHERTSCTVPKHYADGGLGRKSSVLNVSTKTGTMPLGESAVIRVEVKNPLGCPLVMDRIELLVITPSALQSSDAVVKINDQSVIKEWPASVARRPAGFVEPVAVPPNSTSVLLLNFSAQEEGEHCIVGLSWVIEDISGVFLFSNGSQFAVATSDEAGSALLDAATVEGLMESIVESAAVRKTAASRQLDLRHPNHFKVNVIAPQAHLVAEMVPPVPLAMRDGQLHRGVLRLRNTSDSVAATHISLQRSPANAHHVYFEQFSRADNESVLERPLLIASCIEPGAEFNIPFVLRAQMDPAALSSFVQSKGQRQAGQVRCINNVPFLIGYAPRDLRGSSGSPVGSPVASPSSISSPFAQHVRMIRLLRRITVRPSISVATAVSPALVDGAVITSTVVNCSHRSDPPLRICRHAFVLPRRTLCASLLAAEHVKEDEAIACLLTSEQALALSVVVRDTGGASKALSSCSSELAYTDQQVMRVSDTVRSASKADSVNASLGQQLSMDDASFFFAQKCTVGSGSLGECEQRDASEFSFYLDKAGGKSAEALAAEKIAVDDVAAYGMTPAQYPPVLTSVAWFADEDGETAVGQSFCFVDIFEHVSRRASGQLVAATQKASAEELIGAFRLLRSVQPSRGVLMYSARLPGSISATPAHSYVAHVPVPVVFRSWCPLPLKVEVVAKPSSASAVSMLHECCGAVPSAFVTYCGRTRRRFVLLPGDTVEVQLSAECYVPGVVNLNTVEVSATACRYVDGLCSGDPPAVGVAADAAAKAVQLVVLGAEAPWRTSVHFPQPTGLADVLNSGKTPQRPDTARFPVGATTSPASATGRVSQLVKRPRGTSLIAVPLVPVSRSAVAHNMSFGGDASPQATAANRASLMSDAVTPCMTQQHPVEAAAVPPQPAALDVLGEDADDVVSRAALMDDAGEEVALDDDDRAAPNRCSDDGDAGDEALLRRQSTCESSEAAATSFAPHSHSSAEIFSNGSFVPDITQSLAVGTATLYEDAVDSDAEETLQDTSTSAQQNPSSLEGAE